MKHSTLATSIALAADQPPLADTIDVSEFAKPFFDVSVHFSSDVWELCLAMTHTDEFRQNFRIKSLLVQSKIAIKNAAPHLSEASFEVRLRIEGSMSGHERHRILAKAAAIEGALVLLLERDKSRLVEEPHD